MTTLTVAPTTVRETAPERTRPFAWLRDRGTGGSILVAAISSAFGVLLIATTGYIGAIVAASPLGDSATATAVIGTLSVLLIAIAMYVAAIVTANTFSTIVAGRTRQIALMRLIGASARSERKKIASQGFIIGAIGAAIGFALGMVIAFILVPIMNSVIGVKDLDFSPLSVWTALPAVAVILTTWAAAWIGSRRVLVVTPLQALSGSVARTAQDVSSKPRTALTVTLLILGGGLLVLGMIVGLTSEFGVLIAFAGGLVSFTGLALGSVVIMPPILRLVGKLFGNSATARLAAENALRHPERSSRMAIGVVMGVTLVTMFAVASACAKAVLFGSVGDEVQDIQEVADVLDNFAAIMMGLVGISAIIAAVGLVNLLTIGIVQRTRELGLLRALGFTNRQVRSMVLIEAAHVAIASLITGLVLGVLYGWAGAQATFGSVQTALTGAGATIVWPVIPWGLVAGVVVATAALTLIASVVPTRIATRVAPVEALASE